MHADFPSRAAPSLRRERPPVRPGSRRARFLRWLRAAHGWVGLWGAVFGLALGLTGLVLNHRAVLKLPIERGERSVVQIELPAAPATPAELAALVAARLGLPDPQASAATRVRVEPADTVRWGDRLVAQPERWQLTLAAPQRQASVEYLVGNRAARVERFEANALGVLARLHMSVGVGAAWVLLMDSIAGSFVFLAASGLLLWAQARRRRMVGAIVALLPVLAAVLILG